MADVNGHLRMGAAGLAIVKAFESCMAAIPGRPGYFKAYVDPVGVLTIGWGHTNHHEPKFNSSAVWSRAECDAALARDLAIFENHVRRNANVPLKQCEFDALVSWAYNTGGPSGASLWTALNGGNKAIIPAKLSAWNKGGGRVLNGLVRRRKAEGLLFQGKIAEAYAVAQIPLRTAATILPSKPNPPPPDIPKIEAKPAAGFWQAIFNIFRRK